MARLLFSITLRVKKEKTNLISQIGRVAYFSLEMASQSKLLIFHLGAPDLCPDDKSLGALYF